MKKLETTLVPERRVPLLRSLSARSLDQMEDALHAVQNARPRPEIILRWKRFGLLVVLSSVALAGLAITLHFGIPLMSVDPYDAESKVDLLNTYSGVIMGFLESVVGLLLGYLFPVFTVYLHNLKWYPSDDPANKPIGKLKKTALLLFFPIVMIAIGSSLSAVQTNQEIPDAVTLMQRTRRLTESEGVLERERGILDAGLRDAASTCDVGKLRMLPRIASATRIATGFPTYEWSDELLAFVSSLQSDSSLTMSYSDRANGELRSQAESILTVQTTRDLLVQGASMIQLMAQESGIVYSTDQGDASDIFDVMASVFRPLDGVDVENLTATFARTLASDETPLSWETITVDIPVSVPATAYVACGDASCVQFDSAPVLRVRKQSAMAQYKASCSSSSSACLPTANSAFVYGLTTKDTSDRIYLRWTFGKLTWSFKEDFPASCSKTRSAGDGRCATLSIQLPKTQRHLLLNPDLLPAQLSSATVEHPVRLVQLLQPPLQSSRMSVTVRVAPIQHQVPKTCASLVDAYAARVQLDLRAVFDQDVLATASRLLGNSLQFLFQDAIVTPRGPTRAIAWQRHLALLPNHEWEVYMSNTGFGSTSSWIACGILVVLSALVLLVPNARARLMPPKGGNARAERFIAVQTEEVYPNLIYKKRFRIGKTGEKIKFREFSVESVGLHHRMEEDEQIYL